MALTENDIGKLVVAPSGGRLGTLKQLSPTGFLLDLGDEVMWLSSECVLSVGRGGVTLICEADLLERYRVDIEEEQLVTPSLDLDPLALDALPEAVIVTSAQGIVIRWNRAAERLYGWSAEETLGRNISSITVPGHQRASAEDIMERLRRGESWTGDFLVRRRDRSTFIATVTDVPVVDANDNIVAIVGLSRPTPSL